MYGVERLEGGDGALVLRLHGEFDLASEGVLEHALDEAAARGGRVEVDLSGITFLDARRTFELVFRCCLYGDRLVLKTPSPQAAASVRACGLRGWACFDPRTDPAAQASPRHRP